MSAMGTYILSVTAAVILAALIRELAGGGVVGSLVKFLAGLFVAFTLISPLGKPKLPDISGWMEDFRQQGQAAAAAGEMMAEESSRAFIKSKVESYILDKAAGYGVALKVDAMLDENGIPAEVFLWGSVPPAAKAGLSSVIHSDLGITEGAQHWNE